MIHGDRVEFIFLLFLARFLVFGNIARDNSDLFAVGRPAVGLNAVLFARQLFRFAAIGWNNPKLRAFIAIREEGNARAIRRPLR